MIASKETAGEPSAILAADVLGSECTGAVPVTRRICAKYEHEKRETVEWKQSNMFAKFRNTSRPSELSSEPEVGMIPRSRAWLSVRCQLTLIDAISSE